MTCLYLEYPGCKIGIAEQQISIQPPGKNPNYFPIKRLEGLNVFGPAHLSGQIIKALLKNHIQVFFYDTLGRFLGQLHSESSDIIAMEPQWQHYYSQLIISESAKAMIMAKIRNQQKQYRRWQKNNPDLPKMKIKHITRQLKQAENPEQIFGLEGEAAKKYFAAIREITRLQNLPFEYRSKRPPHNGFNSLLSFSYSLLYNQITACLQSHRLNPKMGYLHRTQNRAYNLSLDLIEPLRPLIDSWVVYISKQFDNNDFVRDKGVYLNPKGRKQFLQLYGQWLEGKHKRNGKKYQIKTLIEDQVCNLKKRIIQQAPLQLKDLYLMP